MQCQRLGDLEVAPSSCPSTAMPKHQQIFNSTLSCAIHSSHIDSLESHSAWKYGFTCPRGVKHDYRTFLSHLFPSLSVSLRLCVKDHYWFRCRFNQCGSTCNYCYCFRCFCGCALLFSFVVSFLFLFNTFLALWFFIDTFLALWFFIPSQMTKTH